MGRLKDIIAYQLGVTKKEITEEANFQNDLGMDSIDKVELTMAIEEEYDIEITEEDAEKLTTVKKLRSYLENKAKSKD